MLCGVIGAHFFLLKGGGILVCLCARRGVRVKWLKGLKVKWGPGGCWVPCAGGGRGRGGAGKVIGNSSLGCCGWFWGGRMAVVSLGEGL